MAAVEQFVGHQENGGKLGWRDLPPEPLVRTRTCALNTQP
jgi:hypothetical protein